MDEKFLIKSKPCSMKPFIIVMLILSIIVSTCIAIFIFSDYTGYYDSSNIDYKQHQKQGYCDYDFDYNYKTHEYEYTYEYNCVDCERVRENTRIGFAFEGLFDCFVLVLIPFGVSALIVLIVWAIIRSYELTVTDKRVYGKCRFGRRIDIPLDSISTVATTRISRGVLVASSSGRIAFEWLKNHKDIYETLNELLLKRHDEKSKVYISTPYATEDEMDKLKKYKSLLDSGVITQEEFDTKKKELLGL